MADHATRRRPPARRAPLRRRHARERQTPEQTRPGTSENLEFYGFLLDREFYGLPLDELTTRRRV